MVRVTTLEVKEIISTDKNDVQAFILAATTLIDRVLLDAGHNAAQLKEIERWLSAHFISMSSSDTDAAEVVEEEIGESRIRYAGNERQVNLGSTRYGKQAMLLDTSGKLATIGRGRAQFRVTGPDFTIVT